MENKRLYRSQKNAIIGGVCGGLADYFSVEPVVIRILFVIAFFAGGGGFLVYVVLWIITPVEVIPFIKSEDNFTQDEKVKDDFKSDIMDDNKKQKHEGSLWGGLILIALGAIFLIDRFIKNIDFGDLWPLILVAFGVILISKSFQK